MFSDYALREGVLIDTLQRQGAGPENTSGDASMRSVRLLAERCDDRPEHSENVARIAVSLFDALKSHLDVDPERMPLRKGEGCGKPSRNGKC